MADQDIIDAARTLKIAHIRAEALGGEHQATLARAYAELLAAVGDVEEPAEVTAYRAEVEAMRVSTQSVTNVEVSATQDQTASAGGGQP